MVDWFMREWRNGRIEKKEFEIKKGVEGKEDWMEGGIGSSDSSSSIVITSSEFDIVQFNLIRHSII